MKGFALGLALKQRWKATWKLQFFLTEYIMTLGRPNLLHQHPCYGTNNYIKVLKCLMFFAGEWERDSSFHYFGCWPLTRQLELWDKELRHFFFSFSVLYDYLARNKSSLFVFNREFYLSRTTLFIKFQEFSRRKLNKIVFFKGPGKISIIPGICQEFQEFQEQCEPWYLILIPDTL